MALPIYVQEFKTPETVETFPYFWKWCGTIHISIRFTPCIAAVRTADSKTDATALVPVKIHSSTDEREPTRKIAPAQVTGFLSQTLWIKAVIWKQIILNIGSTTPVSIETSLVRAYVSEI